MKTGRNDPCPCGSGKKYKQCCLDKQSPTLSPTDLAWRRIRQELEGLPTRMLRFVIDAYGPEAVGEAWSEYMLWDDDAPAFDPESPHMPVFMPWLLHCWSPNPDETQVTDASLHEVTPTRAYLDRNGHKLAPVLREYLQSCLEHTFSFQEIERCEPGQGMALRDLLTGELHEVLERSASQSLRPHDVIFAQLVSADGVTLLEATSPVAFPPDDKVEIIELRKRMHQDGADGDSNGPYSRRDQLQMAEIELRELYLSLSERLLYPPVPEFQTSDGEAIEFHKLIYDIDSAHVAFDALKYLDIDSDNPEALDAGARRDSDGVVQNASIDWVKMNPDSELGSGTVLGTITIDGGRLIAEVKSRERAARLKAIIDEKLAAHATFRADEVQTLERALADAPSAPTPELAPQDDPEAQALLASYLQDHYSRWVDHPLPALDNRTPRQVAKTPEGREQVEALMQGAEQCNLALSASAREAIFGSIRKQLGLIA